MSSRVMVVDDDAEMCKMLDESLSGLGYGVSWRTSAQEASDDVAAGDFDAVVADLNMKGMNGIDLCERIAGSRPDIPVIVITAFGSLDRAVAAMRAGAYDFITKPFDVDELGFSLQRAIQHRKLRSEVGRLREIVARSRSFEGITGACGPMKKVFDLVDRVADLDASVLLTGESGTGKELVAQALHRSGRRRGGPFVAVSCAALPETLLESELFGYQKGAFTDARASREGLFLKAGGGTLFLDEIGEMPLSLQPKILRALQEKAVRPVGGGEETPIDVRIVCASNRDLEAAVEKKLFREDLFFRINVIQIEMPPLRVRGADILRLAQEFVEYFALEFRKDVAGVTAPAAEKLVAYEWPGNVRELRNCMERAVALTRYDHIVVEDLPARVQDYGGTAVLFEDAGASELLSMDEIERRAIMRTLAALGGNKTLAARALGLDRRTLYRKIERHGVGCSGRRDR